jgi:hypothetical protein
MNIKNLLVLGLLGIAASCDPVDLTHTGNSTKKEMEQTEDNQVRLAAAQPPPAISVSLERKNLIERLKRLNTENRIGYVYLLSNGGSVMAFYTIQGKVSSLNSLLTTPEQVTPVCQRYPDGTSGWRCGQFTLPSPDFDGSYGKNPEGIFFFTTSGALVEWSGAYLYSDQPLSMKSTPVLVEQLPAK